MTVKVFDTTLKKRQESGTTLLYDEIKDGKPEGMTFQKFFEELNNVVQNFSGGKDSFDFDIHCIRWPEEAMPYTQSLMLHLRKIYLIPKPDAVPDYGIWLEIRKPENIKPEKLIEKLRIPLSVDGLFLKVWNSTNKIILKEMDAL